jgi:hypothetical protein
MQLIERRIRAQAAPGSVAIEGAAPIPGAAIGPTVGMALAPALALAFTFAVALGSALALLLTSALSSSAHAQPSGLSAAPASAARAPGATSGAAPGAAGPALAGASRSPTARRASKAFWEAIRLDDVSAMQTELLRGSDANARHPEFGPAILVAARERSAKALAYLAGLAGTAVDARNANGETALMIVSLNGDLESAKLLVARGAEINRTGWTPLHYAASGGHLPVIQYLLDNNAYIDAQSPNGTTPLMMAARQKQISAARLLVEAGADPTQHNQAALTAADYLERQGEMAEAQWMREQAGAFLRRYGTVERPRRADGSRDAGSGSGPSAPTAPGLPDRVGDAGETAPVGPITTPVKPPPSLPGMRD